MMKKRWYFKNNYEDYEVLYEDDKYILVQNDNTKLYSFGLRRDFGTLYGFSVNQSCLSKEECIRMLNVFIEIAEEFNNVNNTIAIYENMIKALESEGD